MSAAPMPWEEAAQQSQALPWEEAAAQASSTPAVNPHPDMPLLTSQMEATKYGLTQAAKGVGDVAVGIYNLAKPAQTTGESVANSFGPGALPIYRTVQGLYELAKQSAQVPGAIRDLINAPEGAALNALAQTAPRAGGQGAGQLALAGASKLPVGRIARTTGTTLQGMARDIPVVRQLAKVGENWANSATPVYPGAPLPKAPEEVYPGAPFPRKPLPSGPGESTSPGFSWQTSTPEEIQAQLQRMASRQRPSAKQPRPAPAWQTNPQPTTEIPIQGSTPEEIQAHLSRMGARAKTMRPEGAPVEAAVPENAPQAIPLPDQIQPTKATLVDPYRNQSLPQMQPATSTTMEAHGYNPTSQQAFVHFKNGNIYRLTGVPPEMYEQFQNAESQGSFYAQNLKGRYQTDLVGKVKATKPTAGQQVKSALGQR